jgi:hypothetical protein
MGTKTLQVDSAYEVYDLNHDGTVSDSEMSKAQQLIDIENKDKKEDQQRRMAWVAMGSMIVFTAVLFSPMVDVERVNALSDLLGLFYIAQAGIVATFFGASAYMSVNR